MDICFTIKPEVTLLSEHRKMVNIPLVFHTINR